MTQHFLRKVKDVFDRLDTRLAMESINELQYINRGIP